VLPDRPGEIHPLKSLATIYDPQRVLQLYRYVVFVSLLVLLPLSPPTTTRRQLAFSLASLSPHNQETTVFQCCDIEHQTEKRNDNNMSEVDDLKQKLAKAIDEKQQLEREKQQAERQKEQAERRALIAEERTLIAEEDNERMVKIGEGLFFTQMMDIVGVTPEPFAGAFDAICGRMGDTKWRQNRFREYNRLEAEVLTKAEDQNVEADDLTLSSMSISDDDLSRKPDKTTNEQSLQDIRTKNKVATKNDGRAMNFLNDCPDKNEAVMLIRGGTNSNRAHLLPDNKTCSPTMGIIVQAILGFDLEAKMEKQIKTARKTPENEEKVKKLRDKEIRLLQQLAYHKKGYRGFCYLENNTIYIPQSGHELFFDKECSWLFAPIMPLDEMINWHPDKSEYWLMIICGKLQECDNEAYKNLIQFAGVEGYTSGEREKCGRTEVETGLRNIGFFVKALADIATGRGSDKLTPFDLLTGSEDKSKVDSSNKDNSEKSDRKSRESQLENSDIQKIRFAARGLASAKEVKVPFLKEGVEENTMNIMKVRIYQKHKFTQKLPDPLAFAIKSAMNLMHQTGEKATPGCLKKDHDGDDDSDDSSDRSEESDVSSVIWGQMTPQTPEPSGVPPCSVVVVTPPQEKDEGYTSDGSWEL